MNITLCLLTRNELPCLKVIFPMIPAPSETAGYNRIVAIDGGSTDGTVDFFSKNNIPVIAQSRKGRGDAFLQAFAQLDSDAFIFFSPDGNEDIKDLAKFKYYLEKGADIVIASRMMKDSFNEEDNQILKWRKWANNAFNFAANCAFRKQDPYITDSINGYRAITKQAAKMLNLDSTDYTIEYQMTMRALHKKLNIVEFPTIEGQRIAGNTGAPSFSTGIKFIKKIYSELKKETKSKY